MKKSSLKNSFTVVLSTELYDFAEEISETLYLTTQEFIQKIITDNLEKAMAASVKFSSCIMDDIQNPKPLPHKTFYCRQGKNENCPYKSEFSCDEVDF
jgi:hypothetical protein